MAIETSDVLAREHTKGVLTEAGYAALKVCHPVYHCFETDSMTASQGRKASAVEETGEEGLFRMMKSSLMESFEKLDFVDVVLK